MNREIKFRLWNSAWKTFYKQYDGTEVIGLWKVGLMNTLIANGVEIYEGDIVICHDSYSDVYKKHLLVAWGKDTACDSMRGWSLYQKYDHEHWVEYVETYMNAIAPHTREKFENIMITVDGVEYEEYYPMEGIAYEVVGNVFENPELLNKND